LQVFRRRLVVSLQNRFWDSVESAGGIPSSRRYFGAHARQQEGSKGESTEAKRSRSRPLIETSVALPNLHDNVPEFASFAVKVSVRFAPPISRGER